LEILGLSINQLSESIPQELGNLSSLEGLNLNFNQLNGSIPPQLGDLSGLGYLYLNNNQLTGSIPQELGDLSSLGYLALNNNLLTGSIPPELGNLSFVWDLRLSFNQLSGSIPPELRNMSRLGHLYLNNNQLSGSIPPELGIIPRLGYLSGSLSMYLNNNQLSGSIPPELGDLSNLVHLDLSFNQLSGSIPPELEDLSRLTFLYLDTNQLSGVIPPELENLSSLQVLYLSSNQLSGDIPVELENLPRLGMHDRKSDLRWNALHSDSATLIAFLNDKQEGGDWQSTQTIAPVNLTVDRLGDHTVWLSWSAVSYQIDPGGYEVFSAPTGTGVWTSSGWTEPKTDISFPVTGLNPGTIYDLAVLTYTAPHVSNINLVHSDFSLQVMATIASGGCAQPFIVQAGDDPIALSVLGSWDSYLWSTGETDPSIVVDPQLWKWYWVTVSSTGPCEETASTWVGPETSVFADGFESGDTSEWSSKVP